MDTIPSENPQSNRTLSPEHRAKISQSMKGYVKTPEHRDNLSKSNKGKKRTEEQCRANSLKRRGKKMSEEAKHKISEAFKGEKHWNWQGGKPKLPRYGDSRYYPWQIAVFERDNFTCQRCGYQNTHGDFLNAHHIKKWNDFPELRFEVSNGITLCRDCHKKEHGKKPRPQETVYCACGCGDALKPDSVAYGRRFLVGHNSRGRKRPLHERLAIGAKSRNRRPTEEARAHMKEAQQKRAADRRIATYPKEFTEEERERFWANVDTSGECWIWTGSTDKDSPAGRISFRNRVWHSPRLAYVLTHGDIPSNVKVRHRCPHGANLQCVRPDHLHVNLSNVHAVTPKSQADAG